MFGDLTYDFTPQWSVSLGGRYTNDKRHASSPRRTTLRRPAGPRRLLRLRHRHSVGDAVEFQRQPRRTRPSRRGHRSTSSRHPNHNIYLSYSRGFKGGGFDPRGNTTNAPTPVAASTSTTSWRSIPKRSTATNSAGRPRYSTAAFSSRRRSSMPSTRTCRCRARRLHDHVGTGVVPGFCGITTNAGKARMRGVEIESQRSACATISRTSGDRLTLAGTLGYLDGKYQAVHHQHRGSRPDRRCRRPQDPEHAQVDAERHARLRHSAASAVG